MLKTFNLNLLLSLLLLLTIPSSNLSGQAIKTGYAPADGVELFYSIIGEGEPLLVLNGGPGFPSTHFVPLAEKLSIDGKMVILFDQRGTGSSTLSEKNAETINVKKMVADIEALRQHLDIQDWTVMGHSWGGMYALNYAAEHPGVIKGLILSASGGIDLELGEYVGANIRNKLTPEERAIYEANQPGSTNPNARINRLKAMAPAYVYHREHVPAVVKALSETSAYDATMAGLVWQDLYRIEYDLRDELADFQKPTLILQGRQDILGESAAYETHLALPNSEMIFINECSHYLWMDQPEQYFNHINTFWKKIQAKS